MSDLYDRIEQLELENGILQAENSALKQKQSGGHCPTCRKWATYTGVWDADGLTLRCHGCLKAVSMCTCR